MYGELCDLGSLVGLKACPCTCPGVPSSLPTGDSSCLSSGFPTLHPLQHFRPLIPVLTTAQGVCWACPGSSPGQNQEGGGSPACGNSEPRGGSQEGTVPELGAWGCPPAWELGVFESECGSSFLLVSMHSFIGIVTLSVRVSALHRYLPGKRHRNGTARRRPMKVLSMKRERKLQEGRRSVVLLAAVSQCLPHRRH